jgi:hypothetical protein
MSGAIPGDQAIALVLAQSAAPGVPLDRIWVNGLGLACFLLFVALVVVGVVVIVLVLRRSRSTNSPTNQSPYSTPLDRAKAAALELTTEEWDQFRRWVEGPRTPPVGHREGITQ